MRRSVLVLLPTVLLAACGGSGGSSSDVTCSQQFWNTIVATCLPENWKVLSSDTLRSLGVPEETVTAFQNTEPHAGQLDTVTVTAEPLSSEMSTTEYSKANILAVSSLPEYQLIDKEAVYIDGEESVIHVFSARPTPDQPIRRYYQLSAAKDRTGYSFTGSFPLSIQDHEAAQVVLILKNVSFNNPGEGEE